jgi:hypothetical protein
LTGPKEVTFYFHREGKHIHGDGRAQHYRLHQRLFPYQLDCIFSGVKRPGAAEYVATSFDRPSEGFVSMDIDLQYVNAELVKLYFHFKVHHYFQGLGNFSKASGSSLWARGISRIVYLNFEIMAPHEFGTII